MMVQSHLLGALLVGLIASRWRRFTPRDWALALGFSVAVDLDHLLQLPRYVATHSLSDMHPATIAQWGADWQGFMHTSWALLVVGAAVVFWRSWVPLAFWLLHMFQDFVVARHYVVFGSAMEIAIDLALLATVAALVAWDHRTHAPQHERLPFLRHVAATFGIMK